MRRADTGAEGAWQAPLDALRLVEGARALRGAGAAPPVATLAFPPDRHAGGIPPALEFYTKARSGCAASAVAACSSMSCFFSYCCS